MKTKEELNLLKEEVETVSNKLHELTEKELAQVAGGEGTLSIKWYRIQEGDTMHKIAEQFGTTVAVLLALNPEIVNPDIIYAGDWIAVPENPTELKK